MKYTTLYFDLDKTLLDFSAAEKGAIKKLLPLYGIEPKDEYISAYSAINKRFWERFERGEIKREDIFEGRFIEFLNTIGKTANTKEMSAKYFSLLAEGHACLPGAKEILGFVKSRGYTVCIVTNGVSKTQHKRIAESGLGCYFDHVFISEDTGSKKPEPAYFDYVIAHTPEKNRQKILVIGDSETSDILGGINAGMDTCWLNRKGEQPRLAPTYEIRDILDLRNIL